MKTVAYVGAIRGGKRHVRRVNEKGRRTILNLCLRIWNHSPTGFSWGYDGSGPAQLALALLFDVTRDDELASRLHQAFKREVIANLPQGEGWTMSRADVEAFIEKVEPPFVEAQP